MIPLIAVALASQQPINVDGSLVSPRNLLVKIAGPAKDLIRKQLGLNIEKEFKEIGYVLVQAPAGELQLTKSKLKMVSGVEAVEFDRVARVAYEPNDPYFPYQWNLPAMNLPDAWGLSLGTTPTTVAVIDTGVDYTHEDLVNNVWTNPGEVASNGIDDDGNGYVDDVHGYDFAYNDGEPNDNYGHGTACASIVAATPDNAIGLSGVAPMARIMGVKAALDSGYFYDSATVPAYLYAANNGARIFSCSFYADGVSQAEHEAIRYAVSKGVLPIVAAGNDYSIYPFYPGAYEEVIGVAALRDAGGGNVLKSSFSNYGSWVDVSAPGSGIFVAGSGGGYWSGLRLSQYSRRCGASLERQAVRDRG
jgi:subtilisin family serine protease